MARIAREEVFSPDETAIVHVMNRVVRRCFLLGNDPLTGQNFDHRKVWIEQLLDHFASCFAIDLLCFSILSNHFHLVVRNRPDIVATWDDSEVARRWLLLCPVRKRVDGTAEEPSELELNAIRNDSDRLSQIRRRLSDISWWMRLLCQRIGMRANREDNEQGKFFQARFKAVRLLDEASLVACAAYVELNPIRAAITQTLEQSDFTSIQRRIRALQGQPDADRSLAPLFLDERSSRMGPCVNTAGHRCSDLGFLPMSLADYLQLLDWTARQIAKGKPGHMPQSVPPILDRLGLAARAWRELASNFGKLFFHVAGKPQTIGRLRSRVTQRRYYVRRPTREILSAAA